jgi:hypothetical protein
MNIEAVGAYLQRRSAMFVFDAGAAMSRLAEKLAG